MFECSRGTVCALFAAGLFACAPEELVPLERAYEPPPERCEAVDSAAPEAFAFCNRGRGIFGTWELDDGGLPAYDYGLDQRADARAAYFNTEGLDRRDHWASFGNERVNAQSFNDGYVEVVTQDRGPTYLNKFDAENGQFAGGFSYLDDGEEVWSSAYKWRPAGAVTTRRFGMGYFETTLEHAGVRIRRRSYAPPGAATAVLTEVLLENLREQARTLRHYEVWDVARRSIEIDWIVSGLPLGGVPADARAARDARNGLFEERAEYDASERLLGIRRRHLAPAPPRSAPDAIDYYPGDPYLVALTGEVVDAYSDGATFFGTDPDVDARLRAPLAVATRLPGVGLEAGPKDGWGSALGQRHVLVLRSDVALPARGRRALRFGFGYSAFGAPWSIPSEWRQAHADGVRAVTDALRPHLLYFAARDAPVLQRELAWHAHALETSVGYREYWGTRVVPQGSAYLYLHGADGAARDLSLFALPLTYIHADLARDELAMNMLMTYAGEHRIAYSFQGHGMLDDALGLHAQPSDLALFLLAGLGEYLGATGDLAFLDAPMPYYPLGLEPDATVWDHLVAALRFLFERVGTGPHGLVRIGDGDWNDGIVVGAPDRALAVASGESIPNSQMAVAVLPRIADLVAARDPVLADEVRGWVGAVRAALPATFNGEFYGRAYFGDGVLFHAGVPDLEAQVWALIGDTLDNPADRTALATVVARSLDEPSPAGATLVPHGEVWPALSGLLTWGYTHVDGGLAWRHFVRNTMSAHADAYPEVWYGIWSGPDGLAGPDGPRPGTAWYSPVTPMTDFPTMNNNQHALPLLAALRIAGIEANAAGLVITPRVPEHPLGLRSELVDVSEEPDRLAGAYRPRGDRVLELAAPPGRAIAAVRVAGAPIAVASGATAVRVPAPGGVETRFSVDFVAVAP